MSIIKKPHLILFLTKNYSLKKWHDSGKFGRESAIYNEYTKRGFRISFVSYGFRDELELQNKIPGISILYNKWRLPKFLYNSLIPILHAKTIKNAQIIKTNQISGTFIALVSSWIWGKPIVVRCGYLLSEFSELQKKSSIYIFFVKMLENIIFSSAKRIIVASPSMRSNICKNYSIKNERIEVINNYVLTDLFKPKNVKKITNSISYVARMVEQKNHLALVNACADLKVNLFLVGNGRLRNEVVNLAKQKNVELNNKEQLFQVEMPDFLCSSEIYIHPSLYEGSPPKALLEAMSCGLPVICADSPGIREIIKHGENGWLCGTSSEDIRIAIKAVISNKKLRENLGLNGREFILQNFSFEKLSVKEISQMESYFLKK